MHALPLTGSSRVINSFWGITKEGGAPCGRDGAGLVGAGRVGAVRDGMGQVGAGLEGLTLGTCPSW